MLVLVVRRGPAIVSAGPVHEDVAGTEVGKNCRMHFFKGGLLKDVRLVALQGLAGRYLALQRLQSLFIEVEGSDLGSRLGVGFCHHGAENAACPRNYNDFSGKIHIQR